MEMLALLIAVSTTMWFAIDRLKVLWTDLSFGKWITVAVSAVGSFFLTFSFGLDIILRGALLQRQQPLVKFLQLLLLCLVLVQSPKLLKELKVRKPNKKEREDKPKGLSSSFIS